MTDMGHASSYRDLDIQFMAAGACIGSAIGNVIESRRRERAQAAADDAAGAAAIHGAVGQEYARQAIALRSQVIWMGAEIDRLRMQLSDAKDRERELVAMVIEARNGAITD